MKLINKVSGILKSRHFHSDGYITGKDERRLGIGSILPGSPGFRALVLSVSILFFSTSYSYSQTDYYSKSTGDLNVLATWGINTDGSGAAPANFTANDQVFNVRNNPAPTIGASWTVSGTNSMIIIGDGTNSCILTVPGALVLTGTTEVDNNGTLRITSTAATPYSGTLTINNGGTYDHARNGGTIPAATWNIASNCNITGLTATAPGGLNQTFGNFNYASAYDLSLGGNLTVTGNLDISAGSIAANTRIINLTGNLTGTNDLSFTTGTLNIGGSFTNSGTFTSGTGTVNYNGTAQQVRGTTYNNLTISGSAVKTLQGNLAVNGNLNITGGTFNLGTVATAITVTGSTTINSAAGGISFGTVSSKTFTANGILAFTAGTIEMSGAAGNILDLKGNLNTLGTGTFGACTNNPEVRYSAAGAQNVLGLSYCSLVISGSGIKTMTGAIAVNNNLSISGTATLYTNTFQVTGNATGTFTMAANTALTLGATGTATAVLFPANFTAVNITLDPASTVTYQANISQAVSNVPAYGNLVIATNGTTKTCDGDLNVIGNLSINGTAVFSAGTTGSTWNISGNTTIDGTLDFGSAAAKTISINGNLADVTGAITMQGAGLGHTFNLGGANNAISTFNTTAASGSTVNYNRAGDQQIFLSVNYRNLALSGSGIKTMGAGTTTANENLDITGSTLAYNAAAARTLNVTGNLSGTGIIDMSAGSFAHVLNLGGSTNNIGTLTTGPAASVVNYNRAGDQTLFASPNYRSLTFSGGGLKTLQGNITLANALTLTSGLVVLGNHNLTVGQSGTSSAGGVTNMVVANGAGEMRKTFPAGASTFTFAIGDNSVSNDYSPTTITYTANSTIRTIGVRVTDDQHPNDGTVTDYISRYWTFTDNQVGTYTYNLSFNYSTVAPTDLVGLHANLRVNRWDGVLWTQYTTAGASPTISASALNETIAPLNNSSFTGRVNVPVYTWNQTGATADYQVASNWTPSRLSPQPTDIIQFDNNGTTTATNVPTQTIGNLIISNGTTVTLEAAAAATLTIGNVAGTDLVVNSGNVLALGTNVSLTMAGSATATIDGTLNTGSGSAFTTSAASAITTVSGTGIINNTGTVTGSATGLIFNAGSNYNHTRDAGTVPTAGWNAASNCNITGLTATAPAGLGQTFGNFNYNSAFTLLLTGTLTVTGSLDISGGSIDANSRTINLTGHFTGTNDLTFSTGTLNIGGNFGNTGVLTPGTGIVNYNGAAQNVKNTAYYNLTISGSGDKTMQGDVTVGRTATFTAGALVINGNTLNLNYGTAVTAGTITGSNSSDIVITGAGTPAVTLPQITGGLQNLTINKTGATNTVTLTSNLDITGAANFTAGALILNGRTLDLQGTTSVGAGTITGSATSNIIVSSADNSGLTLPNITAGLLNFTVNKTGAVNSVTLGGALTVGGALTLTDGALLLNNFLLTINGSLSQTSGTLTGGGNSDITVGTPAAASITLPTVAGGLRNLTLNRTAGITLGGDISLSGTLTLTSGKITLGTNNLTIAGTAAVGGAGAANHIIADGTGQLRKVFAAGATAAYTLPTGDATGDYSPVSLTFTANSIQRTVGVRVTDDLHPNDGGSSDNISRYWTFTDDLAGGTYTYNASFTYVPADLTGLHANLRVNRWDGSAWTQYTTTGVSPVITVSGVTETTAPFNNSDFTGRVNAVATYNWNQTGAIASFTAPANWTPARLSPQPTDILVFDNNATTTATNVPTQTIGKLILSNGSDVSLQSAAAAQTLTISGGTGTDLDIQTGTTLQLSSAGANQISIAFNPATQDAAIAGTLVINANGALSNSYIATNSNTIVSGTVTNGGGTITSTAANLVFNAGASYNHNRNTGTIPAATWNITSTCAIGAGFAGTAPAGLGQTFGNFTMDVASTLTLGAALTVTNDLNINNGTIAAGGFTINLTGHLTGGGNLTFGAGTLNIGGDNTNTGTFTCGTGTVNYNGTTQIVKGTTYNNLTITGGDVKTLADAATVNTTLTLTSGLLRLGDYNLTIVSANAIAGAPFDVTKMIETNGAGALIRSGNLTNQSFNLTYPVGSGGYYNPLVVTNLPAIAAAARSFSVQAIPVNPGVLSNSINKYWDLATVNITTAVGSVLSFAYNAGEIVGDPLLFQPYTNTSGSWALATGPSVPGSNPATSTGSATITGSWTVGASSTYYSYQTGNWDQASTWTFDPGGTTGPGTTIPGDNDKVVILSGRTVTLQADDFTQNLDITIRDGGFLDLSTFTFTNTLAALRGDGTLKLSSPGFPTATINTFVSSDGGTTEYNVVNGSMSSTQALYYHLTVRSSGTVSQVSDVTLNGNLDVKEGVFRINDATPNRRLKLIINGNVTVDNTGSMAVGTGSTRTAAGPIPGITGSTGGFLNYYENNSHRIQVYGNFTNDGTVRFSNLTYPVYNQFPAQGFATVYFNGPADKTLTCNGQTDFYNLIVDKGVSQTFRLTVYSSAYNNFRLFGANTSDGSNALPAVPSANPNL